ncbi:MAG TPA: hypothetical protein V6D48_00985, partial [Oculatellaceae cyanobacterium]
MDVNVTMLATQYGAISNKVQVATESNKQQNKLDKLLDMFKKMMAKTDTLSDKKTQLNHGQGRLICSNCHKPGHAIENCWEKGGGREGQMPDLNTVKCKQCGEMGHFALQCPMKQKAQKVTYVTWLDNDKDAEDDDDKIDQFFIGTITHTDSNQGSNSVFFKEDSDEEEFT